VGVIMPAVVVSMVITTFMIVMVMLTWGRHVTAVVVRRIEITLGAGSIGLPAIFATLLEATAAATATSATSATACAAFSMAIAARLAGLGRTVLLQGDLLVQGLLAHGL
jgi:hypothetical protein